MGSIGPGTKGTRFISKRYPVDDGITADTTTQKGHEETLKAQEGSVVRRKDKTGIK